MIPLSTYLRQYRYAEGSTQENKAADKLISEQCWRHCGYQSKWSSPERVSAINPNSDYHTSYHTPEESAIRYK